MRLVTMKAVAVTSLLLWAAASCHAQQNVKSSPSPGAVNIARAALAAVKDGEMCFRLSTPTEVIALLGAPSKEEEKGDGQRKTLILEYPGVQVYFGPFAEGSRYGLFQVVVEGKPVDIGRDRMITLRRVDDLSKLDMFSGVANMSLAKLDLTDHLSQLSRLPFDNRTKWPSAERLPAGFEPAKLLESGKNPGLGVRGLHKQGIDGRGVHIAIIDQPLLREHSEYKDRVVEYRAIETEAIPPQMHGAPVTSIAVGKTCGTAPAASVHYYAGPMWRWWDEHCKPYASLLDRIVEENRDVPVRQRVKVVSISLGAFSQWPDHELWVKALKHAADEGILVVSCDSADLRITMLKRALTSDPDLPTSYVSQWGFGSRNALGVPAGNRTTASFSGPNDFIFWRDAGASWTVP